MAKKKRGNGDGSIRQKKNGRWECQLMAGRKLDGRRNIKSFSGATRREVREKMEEFKKHWDGSSMFDTKVKFSSWADEWYEGRRGNVSETTLESYRYTLRTLKNYFGDWQLRDIKTLHIERFLRDLRESGKSDSYITKCRGMLCQVMAKAAAADLINKNPVAYAEKMKKSRPKQKEAFTMEETRLLLEKLPEDRIGWTIRLMLGTGLRSGEIIALEPRHIAEDGSSIVVEQAVSRVKGGIVVGPPKTMSSYRLIPIPENLQSCARNLRNTDKKFIWEEGKPDMPCNPSYFARQFKKAVGSVQGVRVLSPHSTRHTYVSLMQSFSVDLETIRSLVGHTEIDMTRHYLHIMPERQLEAVRRFSERFSDLCNT